MADIKKLIPRGFFPQILIALFAFFGLSQAANAISHRSEKVDDTKVGPPGSAGEPGKIGPAGPAGEKGATGESGKAGATGPKGETGKTGLTGFTGLVGIQGSTGPAGPVGPIGPTGPMGPAGPAGTFSAAYGQLSITPQAIDLYDPSEWSPVPFDVVGASSDMTVSVTSPATITVEKAGTYQVSTNLYFSAEDADEGWFLDAEYLLGMQIVGEPVTPVAAFHTDQSGDFSLSYSAIQELAAGKQIQWFVKNTAAMSPPMTNNVTIESGNAYLMQISE